GSTSIAISGVGTTPPSAVGVTAAVGVAAATAGGGWVAAGVSVAAGDTVGTSSPTNGTLVSTGCTSLPDAVVATDCSTGAPPQATPKSNASARTAIIDRAPRR